MLRNAPHGLASIRPSRRAYAFLADLAPLHEAFVKTRLDLVRACLAGDGPLDIEGDDAAALAKDVDEATAREDREMLGQQEA